MKTLRNLIFAVLLLTGLCGCEKTFTEINLDNLEGSWQKEYAKGVQDAGLVIWTFSDNNNPDSKDWLTLDIYVSDVFAGDSEAKYIYRPHQNGYPGVGSSTPELYLYESDHDFMAEDGKVAFTPAARYYVKECTKDKLVLQRIEVNVDGANLLEGDVAFRRVKP
ncbi:MAG: hypothetical protein IJK74_05640 [Bacteroidales bacterium]|nr:hypothetical protein [Bacteroidales bacterium]